MLNPQEHAGRFAACTLSRVRTPKRPGATGADSAPQEGGVDMT
jgi:hypothetical protein